jgi:tetratricopeptide (TPR) repeat protein
MSKRLLSHTLLLWLAVIAAHASDAGPDSAPTADESPAPATEAAAEGTATATTSQAPDAAATAPNPQVDQLDVAEHEIQTGEYAVAEVQLKNTIAQIEHATTRYDRTLARPLTLLGDALAAQGNYSEALPVYEHARHIIRVNDGLHSPEQIDVVYREAETLASLGKIDEATDRQEYAFDLLMRNHRTYDETLVPGISRLAQWYEHIGNTLAARNLYQSAVVIEQRARGDLAPTLIPPLQGLVRTYRDERFPPNQAPSREPTFDVNSPNFYGPTTTQTVVINRFGEGEQALAQIVRITQADPDATPLAVALAELDLADWYLLFDNNDRAITMYQHAREIMRKQAGLSEAQIATYFDGSKALWLPIPANPTAPAIRSNPASGHVAVQYKLTEHGECRNLKTLESEPEGLMDTKVRRGLRAARFRPEFAGEMPVDVPDKVYRHDFTYYPHSSDVAPVDRASSPPPEATSKKDA